MRRRRKHHGPGPVAGAPWLPWWYQPSRMLLGASLPALFIFSFSDSTMTLSRALLIYGTRDLITGVLAMVFLMAGALLGESGLLSGVWRSLTGGERRRAPFLAGNPRLAEGMLSQRFDQFLMAVFLVSHLVFFRNFILNPGLIAGVLGGNVELKHSFKTIPGVTTWTQVSILLAAIRGLRWSGILPGRVKLLSLFHLVFFGTLFVRAILWSERLAMIEGVVPFFLCALPRFAASARGGGRLLLGFFPILVPVLLLLVFTAFESVRSWGYYSSQHSSVFEFGWRRLYTYYFEAMNTGAATLAASGFYETLTGPLSFKGYESIYEGLYQGTLDVEYNNPSGIWYVATLTGNLLFIPTALLIGWFFGITWRGFVSGRLFGLFFPITFLGLMEILRIPYSAALNRVLPTSLFIILLLVWGATLPYRLRKRTIEARSPSRSGPIPGDCLRT